MKKLFALILVAATLMLASTPAKALGEPNPKGTFVAGVYFGVLPGFGGVVTGDFTITNIWKGHLTGGIQATWNRQPQYSFDINMDNSFNLSSEMSKTYVNKVAIAPRVTYGLNITDAFEVHAGLSLGIGIPIHDSPLAFCIGDVLGLRYFFTPNFGLAFEISPISAVYWHESILPFFSTAANVGLNLKF